MAGIKQPPPPSRATSSSAPSSHRPYNILITLTFLLISALSLWVMRIDTALNDVPADFLPQVESGYLKPFPAISSSSSSSSLEQHQPLPPLHLRKHYTGIAALDEFLAFLVAAFVAGPAGLDPGIRLQQVHFLVSFYAIAAVWAVEASRTQHVGRRSVTWTALYALLYQTVGAAVIIPLFCVAHLAASADGGNGGENGRERGRGRQMRPGYAVALLPATALGYLVPTLAVYAHGYWGGDLDVTQGLIAFWQPAPLLMEVLLVMFASIFALYPPSLSSSPKTKTENSSRQNNDVPHLKRLYLFAGIVTAITHLGVLYSIYTASSDSRLSFSYVFLPNRTTWRHSMALGLHWIFQWDWWGVLVASLLWCWVVVCDVLRARNGGVGGGWSSVGVAGAVIAAVAVVAGPGTAIAAVWSWREDKLVLLEVSQGEGEGGKPKGA